MFGQCAAPKLACIWTTTDWSVLQSLFMSSLDDCHPIRCNNFEGRGGMEATSKTNSGLGFRRHRHTPILPSKSYRKNSMLSARSEGPNKETALQMRIDCRLKFEYGRTVSHLNTSERVVLRVGVVTMSYNKFTPGSQGTPRNENEHDMDARDACIYFRRLCLLIGHRCSFRA